MNKVALEELEQVAGGWNESQLNAEEAERFYEIRNKLEMVKEGSMILPQNELDQLLDELNTFEKEMEVKYGKC